MSRIWSFPTNFTCLVLPSVWAPLAWLISAASKAVCCPDPGALCLTPSAQDSRASPRFPLPPSHHPFPDMQLPAAAHSRSSRLLRDLHNRHLSALSSQSVPRLVPSSPAFLGPDVLSMRPPACVFISESGNLERRVITLKIQLYFLSIHDC